MSSLVLRNKRLSILLFGSALFAAVVSSVSLRYSLGRAARLESDLFEAEFVEIEDLKTAFDEQRNYLLLLGRVGRRSSQTYAFEKSCRRTLSAFTALPRHTDAYPAFVAEAYFRSAQLSSLGGNLIDAQQQLHKAIELAESTGDQRLVAFARNSLGAILVDLTEYEAAEKEFSQAATLLESNPNQQLVRAIALRNLALVRLALGRADFPSVELAAKVLDVHAQALLCPARECWIDCQMTLCQMLMRQGDLQNAQRVTGDVQAVLREMLNATDAAFFDTDVISRDRCASALNIVNELQSQLGASTNTSQSPIVWRWRWLLNLPTETISPIASSGATMCAEFNSQSGLLAAWDGHREVNRVTLEITKLVGDRVPVSIIVADNLYDQALAAFSAENIPAANYQLHIYNTEVPWMRDLGPIPCIAEDGTPVWFDSHVVRDRAWQRISADNIPSFLASQWNTNLQKTALWLEGGAVLSNGRGLTVCSSIVRQGNKDFGMTDAQIDRELRRVTGSKQNVYLEPLDGEPTGHVDMFATLIDEHTIVVGQYADRDSKNGRILDANAKRLERIVHDGKNLNVVRVPMPDATDAYFRTYTNVVFANGILLVPSYRDTASAAMEATVRETYSRLLPDREIHFIDCRKLAISGGALHCLISNLGTAQSAQVVLDRRNTISD